MKYDNRATYTVTMDVALEGGLVEGSQKRYFRASGWAAPRTEVAEFPEEVENRMREMSFLYSRTNTGSGLQAYKTVAIG
jgi:hypothetical protein